MQPVKVSCVSYINSAPFVFGIRNHEVNKDIILSLDTPADCADKLRLGQVDIGLIPVAAIASIKNAHQVTNWCIGANGPVKSVTLLSDVPLSEIKTIVLDFQSVTSNLLSKILALNYWKINPVFLKSVPGFEQQIHGETAGVVIGDRSLQLQHKFRFVYDLSEEWKNFTGLPFVFARWVSNKKIDEGFLNRFNSALEFGINNIEEVIRELKSVPGYQAGTDDYLRNNLSYNFDAPKKHGMDLYLEYSSQLIISEIKELL